MTDDSAPASAAQPDESEHDPIAADREVFERALGIPFTDGNDITALRNGDEIFPAMLDAIAKAEHRIDLLTYIHWEGRIAEQFADSLADRARDGVRVRVILDAFGAKKMPDSLVNRMAEAGIEVLWFRPLARLKLWKNDYRTHRKVMVCDDRVAFTGGVGIAQEWEGDARNPNEWHETHFRIEGPAVKGLGAAFLGNWAEMDQPLNESPIGTTSVRSPGSTPLQVISSSASIRWSTVAMVMRLLIGRANQTAIVHHDALFRARSGPDQPPERCGEARRRRPDHRSGALHR